jgi:hypothetical protein
METSCGCLLGMSHTIPKFNANTKTTNYLEVFLNYTSLKKKHIPFIRAPIFLWLILLSFQFVCYPTSTCHTFHGVQVFPFMNLPYNKIQCNAWFHFTKVSFQLKWWDNIPHDHNTCWSLLGFNKTWNIIFDMFSKWFMYVIIWAYQ